MGVTVNFVVERDSAREVYATSAAKSPLGSTFSKRFVAGLLGILLGSFGIHKFYLGHNQEGVILLVMGTVGWILVLPGIAAIFVGVVEGVIYFSKTDEEFEEIYINGDRRWF